MKTLWNSAHRQELETRLQNLTPRSPRQWGEMSLGQMLVHLREPIRGALGEIVVQPKSGPFRNPLLRHIIIYWAPWPKGAPTAPEFKNPATGEFEADRQALLATIGRFVERAATGGSFEPHPAFGGLSTKDWGALTWRHIDHHLRQFSA